jgi:sigma-B regulation protein RsbQ
VPAVDPLTRSHVTITGNPTASRTLIFIHGFGTNQHAWDQVVARFLRDYRVILFDNAGAGQFDPAAFDPAKYISLSGFVQDLLDICVTLKLRNAILIGHSVGAMIAALASLQKPEYFSKLVMIGASPRYMDDENYVGGFSKADIDNVFSAMAEKYQGWVSGFAPLMMGNPGRSELSDYFAATLNAIPPKTALTIAHAIFNSDHRAEISRITLPTLLIQAQQDPAVPLEVAQYLHRHIRSSTLNVIDASGHLPHISAPNLVSETIQKFLVLD